MFLCNFYPGTDTEAVAELQHILSRKWSHKFLQKLLKLRKEESQKGEERNGWMDSLWCVYLWWLRIKSLGNHIRNYKEYASVLSHQWKRKKKNRIQDCLSVTLGFWEILEVPGGLVVLEKTPRQSRKKISIWVGKLPMFQTSAPQHLEVDTVNWEVNGLSVRRLQSIIPTNSHKHLFEDMEIPHFLCIKNV